MINKEGKRIEALANEIILNGIRLFEERFPDATDKEFTFLYSCIHKQTGLDLYEWEKEKFSI